MAIPYLQQYSCTLYRMRGWGVVALCLPFEIFGDWLIQILLKKTKKFLMSSTLSQYIILDTRSGTREEFHYTNTVVVII